MTKKQKALRSILYPVGAATVIYLALFPFNLWFYHPRGLLSILLWGGLFAAGCVGIALVSFILKDDITQSLPFLKRKPLRTTLYTLSVASSICFLSYCAACVIISSTTTHPFYVHLIPIASELTATFAAGCIGFAIISLILRDYVKQPFSFMKRTPLLITFYILAALGGMSLIYPWGLVLPADAIIIPGMVFGGCLGLAAVSLAFRDDVTLHPGMHKPHRITLYVLITASLSLPLFLLGAGIATVSGPPLYWLAIVLILLPIIGGSIGFVVVTILLRDNIERNLSIAGKIIGVCLVITFGVAQLI